MAPLAPSPPGQEGALAAAGDLSLKPAANRCRLDRLRVIIVDTACRKDAA
jgi:hypothetical protein